MNEIYNIYCDESCHLEFDQSNVMILGATSCPETMKKNIYNDIRDIKIKHGLSSWLEIKWTKLSLSKIDFYLEILHYFFNNENLSYRCVIATGKDKLNNDIYNDGEYDRWYYKMYYYLLRPITIRGNQYFVFIDIKDTNGGPKVLRLHDVISKSKRDFNNETLKGVKQIRSHESEIMQITDLLNGAMAYVHRGLYDKDGGNVGKKIFIDRLLDYGVNPIKKTSLDKPKYNIFIWKPRGNK